MTTDRDAVERLAQRLGSTTNTDLGYLSASVKDDCHEVAIVLRALLSERNHADAQLQAAVAEMRDRCADMVEREGHSLHVALRYLPAPADALERAIEAVVLTEREACAKLADGWQNETGTDIAAAARICPQIAAAIRARSDAQKGKP